MYIKKRYFPLRLTLLFLVTLFVTIRVYQLRVFELGKIRCYLIQTMFFVVHKIFTLKHSILDIYHTNEYDNRNISLELRGLENLFHKFFSYRPLFDNLDFFMKTYTFSTNCMICIVPMTSSCSLSEIYISEEMIKEYNISLFGDGGEFDNLFIPTPVRALWIVGDDSIDNSTDASTILLLHGGGYIFGGASHVGFACHLSSMAKKRILYPLYDMAYKKTIPYQVDQILTSYVYLLSHMKVPSKDIVFLGDSAGGGLCVLTGQKLAQLPLNKQDEFRPAGMVLISPWLNLTFSDAWKIHDETDILLDYSYVCECSLVALQYNRTKSTCPYHSPLYGKCENLPPIYLYFSAHEVLYYDSIQLINKCLNENVSITYEAVDYRPHDWVLFVNVFPEAEDTLKKIGNNVNILMNKN